MGQFGGFFGKLTKMAKPCPSENLRGVEIYREFLNSADQMAVVQSLGIVAQKAPFFQPVTPWGRPMSVRMTSAGSFGWVSGPKGYAYSRTHPSGSDWPAVPAKILEIWAKVSGSSRLPECCLVNFYGQDARMGMHQDRDEADFGEPVVSLSLGDEGLFRVGNLTRGGKTVSPWLRSGDVMVMGGQARLLYHGIGRIRFGSSSLLPKHGRINVTLRVVT